MPEGKPESLITGDNRAIMVFTEQDGGNLGSRITVKIAEALRVRGMPEEDINRWSSIAGNAGTVAVAETFDGQAAFRIDVHTYGQKTQTFAVNHATLKSANAEDPLAPIIKREIEN